MKEGKERSNRKVVTSSKPKIAPAPQALKTKDPVAELASAVQDVADVLYDQGHISKDVRDYHRYPILTGEVEGYNIWLVAYLGVLRQWRYNLKKNDLYIGQIKELTNALIKVLNEDYEIPMSETKKQRRRR